MIKYCLKRIFMVVPVLLGISLLAFLLGVLSPGDPAELVLNQSGMEAPSEADIEAMRQELGLNRPLYVIYFSWLARVLQGDFGTSFLTGKDIFHELVVRLPYTIEIALLSLTFAAAGGILLGLLCVFYHQRAVDRALQQFTNLLLAIPSFWLALLMILFFGEILRWLPTSGSESIVHFIMPAFALSFATMATVCRYVRGALLGEMSKQYYVVACLRGMSRYKALLEYALPNALLPVIALLGNYLASVLGGSVIAETIFAIPGISSLALEAIRTRDYPVLQAYVLLTGWILVLVTLIVDIIIAWVNPKVKLGDSYD